MRQARIGLLLLAWAGTNLFAQSAPVSVDRNAACLACHASAATGSKMRINETHLPSSVHAALACADCHAVRPGEAQGTIPHQKEIPLPDCISACHRQENEAEPGLNPLSYPDSVHGRAYLERGVREVAKCWDCHGKHNIRAPSDPESTVYRKNIPLTCTACHEDMAVVVKYHIHSEMPYQEYKKSVHGKALFEKGLVQYAAVCTDCHGVHDIQGVGEPDLLAKQPQTCGHCHELIFNAYKESIHGQQALAGNIDSPRCVDCHGEHGIASPEEEKSPVFGRNIPDTCAGCHARPEIMKKYGISEDKIATFIDSLHGIAVGYGSKAAATCASCHGVHDILPASDPRSRINPANLRSTCGQPNCHPQMPAKIAASKIHVGPGSKSSPALFIVQRFLVILVFIVLFITIVWFIPGFIRKARLLKK